MAEKPEPIVLELAPLPREQIGPFLLLAVDKNADAEQVEANWAQRVLQARKQQIRTPLGDINWARDVLNDPARRVQADVASLNADTASGVLRRLAEQYGALARGGPAWQPQDEEKPLGDYVPPTEVPSGAEVRSAVAVPEVPEEMPAVTEIVGLCAPPPLDPWALDLFPASEQGRAV